MTDKDLFGKADGLMRRAVNPVGTDTGAVPVLTDFIDPPPVPPVESVVAPAPAAAAGEPDDLEARITARVERRLEEEMRRVRGELAQVVADAVREALADRPVK